MTTWIERTEQIEIALRSIDEKQIDELTEVLKNAIDNKFTIFTAGNGGLASSSQHISEDILTDIIPKNVEKYISCVSLVDNVGVLTAIANDNNYNEVFSLQLDRLARMWDVVILMSGSGNSKNIIEAAKTAKRKNCTVVGFTGFDGGELRGLCNIKIHCDSNSMAICQDVFMSVYHFIHNRLQEIFKEKLKCVS